jgi:hypothetical protein
MIYQKIESPGYLDILKEHYIINTSHRKTYNNKALQVLLNSYLLVRKQILNVSSKLKSTAE